jgi:hypothetical protein
MARRQSPERSLVRSDFDGVDDHVRVPDQAELECWHGQFHAGCVGPHSGLPQTVVVLVDKRSGPTPQGYAFFLVEWPIRIPDG